MISAAHLKIQFESTLAWPTLNKVPHWKGRFLLIKHLLTAARIDRFEPFFLRPSRSKQIHFLKPNRLSVFMQITKKRSRTPSSNLFIGSWELQTKPRLLLLGVSKSTSPGLKLQIQTRLSKDSKQTTGMMTTNLCVFPGEGHHILPIWISRV